MLISKFFPKLRCLLARKVLNQIVKVERLLLASRIESSELGAERHGGR